MQNRQAHIFCVSSLPRALHWSSRSPEKRKIITPFLLQASPGRLATHDFIQHGAKFCFHTTEERVSCDYDLCFLLQWLKYRKQCFFTKINGSDTDCFTLVSKWGLTGSETKATRFFALSPITDWAGLIIVESVHRFPLTAHCSLMYLDITSESKYEPYWSIKSCKRSYDRADKMATSGTSSCKPPQMPTLQPSDGFDWTRPRACRRLLVVSV